MKAISNSDHRLVVRLLRDLERRPSSTIKERNASRQAGMLAKKLTRK